MINSITFCQLFSKGFTPENEIEHNKISDFIPHFEEKNSELEDELKKQNIPVRKGDASVHLIWGDNFLSDSLH
jgi:hypothetical protein